MTAGISLFGGNTQHDMQKEQKEQHDGFTLDFFGTERVVPDVPSTPVIHSLQAKRWFSPVSRSGKFLKNPLKSVPGSAII